ncbi:hypothetical protein PIB30_090669, partial [Stylosanthes scabra]|nr:hypothetical protein [Stylosanthes scabra]
NTTLLPPPESTAPVLLCCLFARVAPPSPVPSSPVQICRRHSIASCRLRSSPGYRLSSLHRASLTPLPLVTVCSFYT